jgi:hypothetical protein
LPKPAPPFAVMRTKRQEQPNDAGAADELSLPGKPATCRLFSPSNSDTNLTHRNNHCEGAHKYSGSGLPSRTGGGILADASGASCRSKMTGSDTGCSPPPSFTPPHRSLHSRLRSQLVVQHGLPSSAPAGPGYTLCPAYGRSPQTSKRARALLPFRVDRYASRNRSAMPRRRRRVRRPAQDRSLAHGFRRSNRLELGAYPAYGERSQGGPLDS